MAFQEKEYHREENCLNCGYPLIGKFCGNCGQKAFLHKDSFWHMASHFIGDYFHYDSKFWITLKTLFTKPGLAALEYIQGKRVKYLTPIQLYVFVTTVFFLFFFSLHSSEKSNDVQLQVNHKNIDSVESLESLIDSVRQNSIIKNGNLTLNENNIQSYDSVQHQLPDSLKDDFITRFMVRKFYIISDKYGTTGNISEIFIEKFVHNIPKIFFILLPFFAFLLLLIFRKQKYYYVDHIIFSLHFHVMLFMLLGITAGLTYIIPYTLFHALCNFLCFIGIGVYLFFSLKKVYPSGSVLLFFKQCILTLSYFIAFFVVASIYFIITLCLM